MSFKVDEQVVHPSYGIGRIVGLVTKSFFEAKARRYYEVSIERSTVWVPVDDDSGSGLRRLTRKDELTRCRAVLRSCPETLTPDHQQRRLELLHRQRQGDFVDRCRIVRDLTARGWHKALTEADADVLRKSRDSLCQEWAAVMGVSVADAMTEVTGLLAEGRDKHEKTH
jgi:RNA polymerase-interacting CarD/CdnL/TRCF family regulator